MSLADDLAKLNDLHRSGALSDEEFARAKETLLNAPAPTVPPTEPLADQLSAQLEEVQFQNELAQLDREWERDREKYMMTGRFGHRYLPNAAASIAGGFAIVGFGVVWTVIASVMAFGANQFLADREEGPNPFSIIPCLFPLFGVLFVIVGIVVSVKSHTKAGEYQRAEQAYQQRRAEVYARYSRK